jgi:hypothetical protein
MIHRKYADGKAGGGRNRMKGAEVPDGLLLPWDYFRIGLDTTKCVSAAQQRVAGASFSIDNC